jgi:outer membrane receptor protein involved in Fe transport
VLRSIPGVRSESSGGESNANLTIRGLPISAGGARYVQFQEDGLPVLQIGDLNFGTPDTWVRVDNLLDRLEVVRGGAASTLATGSPGGIINFLSKTGTEQGGLASVTLGLEGYDQTRYEFGYGGKLAPKTRFYLGGHYRAGEGARDGGVRVEQGGQIRANITQQLDNGYIRVHFKHLDDHAPTLLPVPVRYGADGGISEIAGIDPRRASFYSPYWGQDLTLTGANTKVASNINDGLTAKSSAIGVEGEFDLGQGWKLADKFRVSRNTGRFIGIFPGSDVAAAPAGTTYLTGPKAGQAYSGNAFTAVVFNTSFDDVGLTANDLKLSKDFPLAGGKLSTLAGLYTSTQKVAMTWNFNQYLLEANGNKPALLSSADNGTPAFGGCCMNLIDASYSVTAPYLQLGFEAGPLSLDGSVRHDKQKASGFYKQTLPGQGGVVAGEQYNLLTARTIDYTVSHTSYSLGANYRLTNDMAVFGRYSEGVAFNGDRIAFFSPAAQVDGSAAEIPINKVTQFEAGLKWRSGGLSTFATLFWAKTKESNVDVTANPIVVTANEYDAKGLELEAAWRVGGLRLSAGATYTDAEITKSTNAAIVGKTPRRQAKLIYQVSPSYSVGDLTVGASLIGTTGSRDDGTAGPLTVQLPGYQVVNAFVNYQLAERASLQVSANNLLDKIGYTESNDGRGAARSINGRTIKATLVYEF